MHSSFASFCNVAKSVLCDITNIEKRRVLIRRFCNSLGLDGRIFRVFSDAVYVYESLMLLMSLVGMVLMIGTGFYTYKRVCDDS